MEIKKDLTSVNYTGKRSRDIKALVIHSMWGTYAGSIQWFKNPNAGASSHYCISALGEITQCVLDKDVAWHAGVYDTGKEPDYGRGVNPNEYTIGIELEDKRDSSWKYPQEQREALVWLVNYLCEKWLIPKNDKYILLHKNLNPSRRSDPVGAFDLDWVLGGSMPPDEINWEEKYNQCEVEFSKEQQRLIDCRTDRDQRDAEISTLKNNISSLKDEFTTTISGLKVGLESEQKTNQERLEWLANTLGCGAVWSEIQTESSKLVGIGDLYEESKEKISDQSQTIVDMGIREKTLLDEIARLKIEAKKAKGLGDASTYELLTELANRFTNILRRNK